MIVTVSGISMEIPTRILTRRGTRTLIRTLIFLNFTHTFIFSADKSTARRAISKTEAYVLLPAVAYTKQVFHAVLSMICNCVLQRDNN